MFIKHKSLQLLLECVYSVPAFLVFLIVYRHIVTLCSANASVSPNAAVTKAATIPKICFITYLRSVPLPEFTARVHGPS